MRTDDFDDLDRAEPEPGTIGAASRTAKCFHCGERIGEDSEWGWQHLKTGVALCAGQGEADG